MLIRHFILGGVGHGQIPGSGGGCSSGGGCFSGGLGGGSSPGFGSGGGHGKGDVQMLFFNSLKSTYADHIT